MRERIGDRTKCDIGTLLLWANELHKEKEGREEEENYSASFHPLFLSLTRVTLIHLVNYEKASGKVNE